MYTRGVTLATWLTAAVLSIYVFIMLLSQPICYWCYGDKGCGNSLDNALYTGSSHGADPGDTRSTVRFRNPQYVPDLERLQRRSCLLGLSLLEADFGRRLGIAGVLGAVIGLERRVADRPAGVRTMCLVSIGSAMFTLCSTWAFMAGPQAWDASRVAAAVPSGVGFLGAGLIWKGIFRHKNHHEVHGLTTAASMWISGAAGMSSGGGLYFLAVLGVAMSVCVLRFGPRTPSWSMHADLNDDDVEDDKSKDKPKLCIGDVEVVGDLEAQTVQFPSSGVSNEVSDGMVVPQPPPMSSQSATHDPEIDDDVKVAHRDDIFGSSALDLTPNTSSDTTTASATRRRRGNGTLVRSPNQPVFSPHS